MKYNFAQFNAVYTTNMQIDTNTNDTPALQKERMKSLAAEYMSKRDQQKKIQNMIGKQANRFDVNLDDLR